MRVDLRTKPNGTTNSVSSNEDRSFFSDTGNKVVKEGWLSKWTNYLKGCEYSCYVIHSCVFKIETDGSCWIRKGI